MTHLYPAAVFAMLLAPAAGQQKEPQHLLRLSLADGGPAWFRVRQEMTASVTLGGETSTNRIRMDLFWKTRIERTDGAPTKVVHELVRVRGAGGGDHEDYVYDSALDGEPPRAMARFDGLVGTEITLEVDSKGHVRQLGLSEALRDFDRRSGVSTLTISDMIRPLDLELPELPVAVGARWPGTNAKRLAADDKFAFESEYSLAGVAGGKARIRQRFVVREREAEDDALGRRAERTFTLDLGTGRVVAVEDHTVVEEAPGGGEMRLKLDAKRESCTMAGPPGELEPLKPPPAADEKKK